MVVFFVAVFHEWIEGTLYPCPHTNNTNINTCRLGRFHGEWLERLPFLQSIPSQGWGAPLTVIGGWKSVTFKFCGIESSANSINYDAWEANKHKGAHLEWLRLGEVWAYIPNNHI
jgi:hypothetical protein